MSDLVRRVKSLPTSIVIDGKWVASRDKLVEKCVALKSINSQDEYDDAGILLKKLTKTSNGAEELRKKATKPLDDFKSTVKEMVDEAREPLEEHKARIKKEMGRYWQDVENKRQAELEAKTVEVAKKVEADPFAMLDAEPVKLETRYVEKTISTIKKVWKFRIIDESLVPREFCSPNESKIREYVNANKDAASITGVETYEELDVRSR